MQTSPIIVVFHIVLVDNTCLFWICKRVCLAVHFFQVIYKNISSNTFRAGVNHKRTRRKDWPGKRGRRGKKSVSVKERRGCKNRSEKRKRERRRGKKNGMKNPLTSCENKLKRKENCRNRKHTYFGSNIWLM